MTRVGLQRHKKREFYQRREISSDAVLFISISCSSSQNCRNISDSIAEDGTPIAKTLYY
jgi:hypothetical protein